MKYQDKKDMKDLDVKRTCKKIHEVSKRIIAEGRAREFLIELGTHTPNGEISPQYGGSLEKSGGKDE